MDVFYRYWGKASFLDNEIRYHLLPYHCLDVTAVAARWWDNDPHLQKMLNQNVSRERARAWVLFFVALHDLGKWDIRFQAKAWQAWCRLNPDEASRDAALKTPSWNHGHGGLYWLYHDFDCADSDEDGSLLWAIQHNHPKQDWLPWMAAVAGHHGYVAQSEELDELSLALPSFLKSRGDRDRRARLAWLHALEELFLHPAGLSLQDDPPACSPLLAGFCSVADWLGSWCTEDTFQYHSSPEPLSDYFLRRYNHDAQRVLTRSGLLSAVQPWRGVTALLKSHQQPRQLQTLVSALPTLPGLTLIEAPTGSGKTETALAYAWRLLAAGQADSIIFALPTQATANAMFARLDRLATTIFEQPNLILAHGHSRFNHAFSAVKLRGENLQGEEAWAQCCEWLSRSNKRAFLGQIGVCTIDQVLISVLPVKHRFIRGLGIARSVLLVDEIHAYDSYMHGLLEEVLRKQYEAGQSALLLSATLPAVLKSRLLATYGTTDGASSSRSEYPLVTWQHQHQRHYFDLSETPAQQPPDSFLQLEARYLTDMQPDEALLADMVDAAEAGAQVCLVCNLVDVAQQIYQRLSCRTSAHVMLFHSRFTALDRADIEQRILQAFGPEGDRHPGRILIATQVVEQSLDLDFDWLITQHCPADLLFQRAGRLHRHVREMRPKDFQQPILTVVLPVSEDYGNSNFIYTHTRVMWRTQQLIERQGDAPLQFPAAYRQWIDCVYDNKKSETEPSWVSRGMEKYQEQELLRRSHARLMLNEAQQGCAHSDDDANVRAVTRDGEMSLPLIPYAVTGHGKMLLNGQSLEPLDAYSLPEALALNRVNVPHSWERRYGLTRNDRGEVWVEGRWQEGVWRATEDRHNLLYSREMGMIFIPT
ncbi:CRISPR-associated helicase/endonuclease Cas3 [Pantoea sp. 1.19]|uniref:CRISPR-associated helicase/endonuclease Cas3 n=1 Tax=Pantoea sp. 1.19 TaxID=1925589 RepID=UPI000948FF52|nr:CRISPR-associated helicase/endonuclease Cas3 [Pantoea sp. 1.19]